jgi:hypothetical protein
VSRFAEPSGAGRTGTPPPEGCRPRPGHFTDAFAVHPPEADHSNAGGRA